MSQLLFGRCKACNRMLQKNESVKRGYGDICYKKMKEKCQMKLDI